jgi:phosphatidylglycerophosphate synthase
MEPAKTPGPCDDKVMRTPEIEEASNRYFIHPLSRRLVRHFARWGWSPNAVSLLGMLSAAGAAICLYHYHDPIAVMAGFVLLIGWHVFDGADGQLARLTGKTSELGLIIDGLCDHLGMAMVYVSLSMAMSRELGSWVWVITLGAGVSHIVQASAFEFQRNMYDCWVHGKTQKCAPSLDTLAHEAAVGGFWRLLIHRAHLIYVTMQYRFAAVDPRLTAIGPASGHQPGHVFAAAYQKFNQPAVRNWSWLSANKRTLALSALCLLHVPLVYFLLELVVLNMLLWHLQRQQTAVNSALVNELRSAT